MLQFGAIECCKRKIIVERFINKEYELGKCSILYFIRKKGYEVYGIRTKIDHRGSTGDHARKHIIKFSSCTWNLGVDGIELDVQLTSDGHLVVIHDEKIDRTTNGTGYVKGFKLNEIKQFSAGVKFSHFEFYIETDLE